MRTIGVLPESVLMLEIIGMVLLSPASLSLNDYPVLPAPLGSPLACAVMIFLGVLLMLPAAVALMRRVAQLLVPQPMPHIPGSSTDSGRDKRDDSNH